MTMIKREVNNIWSRVRPDVDIDDLILNLTGAFAFWLIFWPVTRHVNHLLRGNKA